VVISSGQIKAFEGKTYLLTLCPSQIPHGLHAVTRDDRPAINRLNQVTAFDLILNYFVLMKELKWI
jgi:hypothetical protein